QLKYLCLIDISGVNDDSCWSLNYVHSRICALEGSSVNISSKYSHPDYQQIQSKCWYKVKRNAEEDIRRNLTEDADHVEYDNSTKNQHILRLKKLKRDDSAEYRFTITTENEEVKQFDFPGISLTNVSLSELRVKMSPSAVVTEGQRVTLTCSTSCPLTDNTNYIWYLNSRPLTPRENQNKYLILDPVSREDAGSYSFFLRPHFGKSNTEPVSRNLASSLLTVAWEMGGLVGCLALKSAAMTRLLRSPDINTISILTLKPSTPLFFL
uniref:Ig-like domain-containing protein n=1 Tax=Maylandia zebra TaxID=106582 RepID=A0A3P9BGI0_9CICH